MTDPPDEESATGGDPSSHPSADPASAARSRVETDHGETLAAVRECAEAVAATWDGEYATERRALVAPMKAALERSGTLSRLPAVLADAVDATGRSLSADPVPAPPYVAVTSVGPVLRATLADGRLVLTLRTFAVERGERTRYALAPSLSVETELGG